MGAVDVPKDKDVINVKWIYKTKQDADANVKKHKARMVARGFTQQPNIDFNETFARRTHRYSKNNYGHYCI